MIRVLIGVPTGEKAREAAFYDVFYSLQLPVGTMTAFAHGPSIAHNRNHLVRQALDQGCSHIFFLDDDVIPNRDILIKLVCHNLDIVTGLQLSREYPHAPLIFSGFNLDGFAERIFLNGQPKGLLPIAASGLGCCLIKLKVFSKLEEPWFRFGELEKDGLGEDLGFFKRVQEIGLKSYCDPDVTVGHITNVAVWPKFVGQGEWHTAYKNNNGLVSFPAVQKPKDE